MEAWSCVLPNRRDLSHGQLLFLEEHFSTHEDLSGAPDVAAVLVKACSDLESRFTSLHAKLATLAVSWISRSFILKSDLRGITLDLQNLSLRTSPCVINKKVLKTLGGDLPLLKREVRRIETIREYAETTLQLEALVGDLEDAVICIVNQHARNMFSTSLSNSSFFTDFGPKHRRLLQTITTMNDIEDVLVNIANCQQQWWCLLKSVDARVGKSLAVIRPQVLADHRSLLASLGWPPKLVKTEIIQTQDLPNPLVLIEGERRECYSLSFQTLCALQHLQTRREERQLRLLGQKKEKKLGLWAIDELASPIASRTEYHFSKWTEQPELMFALVYKITQNFVIGVDEILQPLIDRARVLSCSAKEAWVSAMVKMLSGYLVKNVFPVLASKYKNKDLKLDASSSWLHLVDLIVDFDRQMQLLVTNSETYPLLTDSSGISVLSIFCDRPDWLKIWRKIELKDALKKFKTELKNERAWLICREQGAEFQIGTEAEQFVLLNREDYKAPLVADSALKVVWEMVERCRTLPGTLSRVRFIRSTASRFLWYFFEVMLSRRKRVEPMFVNPNDDDDVLIRLCGLINTASYCESKLQEWSDDVNFLELRIAENGREITDDSEDDHENRFFWEEIRSLSELQTNWLMDIIADILYRFDTLSLKYFKGWERPQPAEKEFNPVRVSLAAKELVVSSDFVKALDALRSQLGAMEMNLNPKDFLDLWRSVADGVDHFVLSKVAATNANKLHDERITQFGADMEALLFVFRSFCARPEAFFPGIRDSLRLLLEMGKEEVNHLLVCLLNDACSVKQLRSSGISHVSFDQARKILSKRNL